jgi:tRNA-specific adenosine deaminase 3
VGEGGCVLVGSRSDADVRGVNPLMTAAMIAIDGVAARHRVREAAAATRGLNPPGQPAKRRRIVEGGCDDAAVLDADAVHEAATSSSSSSSSSSTLSVAPAASMPQYICTGFDAFLTHEPDLFDAMALLHSRVSRVIFGEPDALCGAVGGPSGGEGGGALRLQEVRELNHHYSVWRVGGVVGEEFRKGLA